MLGSTVHSPAERRIGPYAWFAALAIFAALPFFLANPFIVHLAVLACIHVIAVSGLALISRAGQLSLCHGAFIGCGAYASALSTLQLGLSFSLATAVGVGCAAAIAAALGWVILRLTGVYFVLVTFAFGELVRLALLDWSDLTGGANGITGIPSAALLGFVFDTKVKFYGLALAAAAAAMAFLAVFVRTPAGHAMDAVADNPALAESTGLSVRRYQHLAFVLGCALAGLSGSLVAHYIGYISPETFNVTLSVAAIIMLVIGGRQSVWGPLVGALLLTPLPELFRGAVQTQHVFYGAALIVILRFLPGGLVQIPALLRSLFERRNHGR